MAIFPLLEAYCSISTQIVVISSKKNIIGFRISKKHVFPTI
jgi:hypothetical protein